MERRIVPLIALCMLWLSLCAGGMGVLIAYTNGHGNTHPAPRKYVDAEAARSGHFALLMFLHPKCPCSRASVSELAKLMTRCSDKLDATVYFFHPPGHDESWSKSPLWRSAERIPHVKVALDGKGARARHFGAATSGHAFLYGSTGELVFDGGITAGRGHEGDNTGRAAITDLAEGRVPTETHMPVFGCSIYR